MICDFDFILDDDEFDIEKMPKTRNNYVFRNRMTGLEMWDDKEFFMGF